MLSKAAIESGLIAFSDPPAIIALASPLRIVSQASPIVLLLVAQAETAAQLGPRAPVMIETIPAALSTLVILALNGLIRSGPFSRSILAASSNADRPPALLPM